MIDLNDLREATGGQPFGEIAAQQFSDFCYDARLVQPGQLYVALKDARGYDGHAAIGEAIAGGASGVLCTIPPTGINTDGVTILLVSNTTVALGAWARHVLSKYDTTVVGVTGAVGKSSAREAIATVLGARYKVYKSPVTFNGQVGLALGLGGLIHEHQVAVVELASSQFGEMGDILSITHPHIVVVTGAGRRSGLGAQANSLLADLQEITRSLPANGALVLNADDASLRQTTFSQQAQVTTYGVDAGGRGAGADVLAYDIKLNIDRVTFGLSYQQSVRLDNCSVPLPGTPTVYASLAALAVGNFLKVPIEEGVAALAKLPPLPGRLRLLQGFNQTYLLDDTFDASPESTLAALDLLGLMGDGQRKRIFVMGDMLNTGDDSQLAYRAIGRRATDACDVLVTRGAEAAQVGSEALKAGLPAERVALVYSHADAIGAVRRMASPGDVILVKGSKLAAMERVTEGLLSNPQRDAVHLPRRGPVWRSGLVTRPEIAAANTWLELDLDAAASNVRAIKERIGPDVALAAVVKANAYGHGALEIASTALQNGASLLAVDNVEEGLNFREAGLTAPILVLGVTPAWAAYHAITHDLTVAVHDADMAREFNRVAAELDRKVKIHVKVDSGMGRMGLLPDAVPALFRELAKLDRLEVEGIFSHLAAADSLGEAQSVVDQFYRFQGVVETLGAAGIKFKYVHMANSPAIVTLPEAYFTLVRSGLLIYGLSPSNEVPAPPEIRPVLTWKTRVAQVKTLPPGSTISYGNTYRTDDYETVALLPVGYAYGFRRGPRNWGEVLVRGQRAPIRGRVTMGMTVVSVTHILGVQAGDEVVLIGRQGDDTITAEEVAERTGTINYEVTTALSPLIPRIV